VRVGGRVGEGGHREFGGGSRKRLRRPGPDLPRLRPDTSERRRCERCRGQGVERGRAAEWGGRLERRRTHQRVGVGGQRHERPDGAKPVAIPSTDPAKGRGDSDPNFARTVRRRGGQPACLSRGGQAAHRTQPDPVVGVGQRGRERRRVARPQFHQDVEQAGAHRWVGAVKPPAQRREQ
jgi:hypothetical protein